jgi:hypothetical protein
MMDEKCGMGMRNAGWGMAGEGCRMTGGWTNAGCFEA